MKLISFITASIILLGVVQAAETVKGQKMELPPACKVLMKEILETQQLLGELAKENGKVPVSVTNEQKEYLANLMALFDRAKGGDKMDVQDELYSLTLKSSAAGGGFY